MDEEDAVLSEAAIVLQNGAAGGKNDEVEESSNQIIATRPMSEEFLLNELYSERDYD